VGSPDLTTIQDKIQWIQNNLTTVQILGNSVFPEFNDISIDYLLASTSTTQEEPDTRLFNYTLSGTNGSTGGNFLPNPTKPTRYWSDTEEDSKQAKFDVSVPFPQWSGLEATLKGGFNVFKSDRNFWERQLAYNNGAAPWTGGDPNDYLTEDNLGYDPVVITGGRIRWNWQRTFQSFSSSYTATRSIPAAYLMTDFPLVEPLRLVGGARVEKTEINIDSESYLASSFTGSRFNTVNLDQTDILPSVGLIWSARPNMSVRANWSQTLARPSFRELAAYRSYDPNLDIELEGNPTLQITSIQNFDLSWDWYPRPSSLVGVGFFYKTLELPIEQVFINTDGSIMSWQNRESADVLGVEFEARQQLDFIHSSLAYFSLGGNLALIQSSTDLTAEELQLKEAFLGDVSDTRPLSEQSPYILNLDASYNNEKLGTLISVVFNVSGPRLLVASLTTDDVYEQPTPQLDLITSQRICKNLYLKFNIKNILNPTRELTYGKDTGLIFSTYSTGTTFQLGLDMKF
jgi:TonB-dependent receptor